MDFEIKYSGGVIHATAGLDCLVIYEQEFGSDLIHDVFGVVKVTAGDLEEAVADAKKLKRDDVVLTVDYTKNNWTKLVQAVWACAKSHDSNTAPFKKWLKETEGINLIELNSIVLPIFNEVFFPARNGDAGKEADTNS